MAENDVTIQINVDAKDAQAAIELFGRESVKVLKNSESQIQSFGQAFAKVKVPVVAAIGSIVGAYQTMSAAINEAVEDAKLTRQIEASLRATDEASAEAVRGIVNFADAVKEATGVSDDLVKQTFITAKSFGVTAEEAKALTEAAIDLAAATGVDAETAVRQLGGTLDGSIGKIGNLGAEFRNLTTEQLKAGDAIDLVTSKFGGTAAKELDTYQGATNQFRNAWSDLLKELGKTATESGIVQSSLSNLAKFVDNLSKKIADFREGTSQITGAPIIRGSGSIEDLRELKKETEALSGVIGKQSKEIEQGFAGIVKATQGSTSAVLDFEERLASFPAKIAGPVQKTGKELEELQKKAKKLAEEAQAFKTGIFGNFGTQAETESFKAQQALQKLADFEKKGAFSTQEAYNIRIKIVEDFNLKQQQFIQQTSEVEKKAYEETLQAAKAANDQIRAEFEKQQSFLKSVFENPFANLADKLQLQLVRAVEFLKTGTDIGSPFKEGEIAASVSGGIALALQGKAGATKAISGVAEAIGASFGIPGLGAITELLARGPEETKKFIKEFIKAIPDIIQAISESIPVVVETIVDVLVNKGGAARIGIAIAKAMVMQPVWARLGQEVFGKSGNEIAQVIRTGITEGGTNARDGFKEFFTQLGPTIVRAGKDFGRDIQNSIKQAQSTLGPAIRKEFDTFISTIGGFFNQIGPAFQQFLQALPRALFDALSALFRDLGNALSEPLAKVFEPLQSVTSDLNQTILNLFDPIERLIDALSGKKAEEGIRGIGKKIGDYLDARGFEPLTDTLAAIEPAFNPVAAAGKIGKALGFAKGGLVYAADGFVNRGTDTVPAMLTPGELVVPRDMVGELASFLQRQSPDSAGSDTAMLAAILSAVQAPIVVKTEAKVNQNAFADIILQLNRQNARLRA